MPKRSWPEEKLFWDCVVFWGSQKQPHKKGAGKQPGPYAGDNGTYQRGRTLGG